MGNEEGLAIRGDIGRYRGNVAKKILCHYARQSRELEDAFPIHVKKTKTSILGSGSLLFPFDGSGGFRTDIETDSIDAANFVNDPVGNPLQQFMGQLGPIRSHGIRALDDT